MAAGDSLHGQATNKNRVNQRNFRARRQAYIRELEQRLQRTEKMEVRATKEVQIAAQRVDNENRLLRLLLRTQFGITDSQANAYLAGSIAATDMCTYKVHRNLDGNHGSTTCNVPPSGTDSSQHLQGDSNFDFFHIGKPTGFQKPSPLQIEEYERHYRQHHPTHSHHAPANKKTAGSCSPSMKRAHAHAGETSCVEAAKIIAGLRGCNVDEDIWSELGCRAKQSCKVQNISIFELMDKA